MSSLRVWWVPQVPMKAFYVPVETPEEGAWIMSILAEYDLFQYQNNVKPDYSNTGGLETFENNEWVTWYSEYGEDIDEYMENQELEEEK